MGLSQPLLGLLALGDVLHRPDQRHGLTGEPSQIPHRRGEALEISLAAVVSFQLVGVVTERHLAVENELHPLLGDAYFTVRPDYAVLDGSRSPLPQCFLPACPTTCRSSGWRSPR